MKINTIRIEFPFTIIMAFLLNQMNLKFWILYYFYYVLL